MDRRFFLKSTVAASPLLCISTSRIYAMDPVTLSIVLGLIGASGIVLSAKIQSETAAASQLEVAKMQFAIEKMRQDFEIRKLRYQMGLHAVWQDSALDGGSEADMLLSPNVDGYGTEFGISGRPASRRGQYEGSFSTVETARFANEISRGKPMPVPVEKGYHALSPAQAKEKQNFVGQGNSIIGGRFYSSARSPTRDGWDIETIIYANSNNKVESILLQRPGPR